MLAVAILITLIVGILAYSVVQSKRKYKRTMDEKLQQIKAMLCKIEPRAHAITFYTDDDESYTLGNDSIHMCLKDSKGEYHDDNFLVYIGLHELAHAIIPEDTSKHPPIFDQKFSQLKDRATHMGIYDPTQPFPKEYCKKEISKYY